MAEWLKGWHVKPEVPGSKPGRTNASRNNKQYTIIVTINLYKIMSKAKKNPVFKRFILNKSFS